MGERPALYADDNEARDRSCDHLSDEHDSGRDLHIVAKFQVAGEVDGLFGHDGAVNLEDHNSNGPSGNDVAGNELGEDAERHLLVGDCKEGTHRENEDHGEDQGEDVSPKWHLRVVNLNGDRSKDEGDDKNDSEPPVGNVAVARHKARVNVFFVLDTGAELPDNVTPVPQVGVGDNCGEGGKAQAIVEDKRC